MTDDSIMPDGRPLFAWRNELEMLRSKEQSVHEKLKEAHRLSKLAGIVEIYREQNPHSLEMILRITLERMQSSDSWDPLDSAEIVTPL